MCHQVRADPLQRKFACTDPSVSMACSLGSNGPEGKHPTWEVWTRPTFALQQSSKYSKKSNCSGTRPCKTTSLPGLLALQEILSCSRCLGISGHATRGLSKPSNCLSGRTSSFVRDARFCRMEVMAGCCSILGGQEAFPLLIPEYFKCLGGSRSGKLVLTLHASP